MNKSSSGCLARKHLSVHVTKEQHDAFIAEADKFGYDCSSLMRLCLFGNIKGLRLVRRPHYNTRLLGDAMGRLTEVTSALNQNGFNISRIAEQLNQKNRDLFGLDGALCRFDQLGQELLKTLNLIDAVVKGRRRSGDSRQLRVQTNEQKQ